MCTTAEDIIFYILTITFTHSVCYLCTSYDEQSRYCLVCLYVSLYVSLCAFTLIQLRGQISGRMW